MKNGLSDDTGNNTKRKNATKYDKMNQNIVEITKTNNEIKQILIKAKEKLTMDGRKAVFEDGKELKSEHMHNPGKPETFTKNNIIRPVFKTFGIELKDGEMRFKIPGSYNYVDLVSKYGTIIFPIQAKPMGQNLYKKSDDGAVQQIKYGYENTDFYKKYKNGAIATDGINYIIINREGMVVEEFDINTDSSKLKKLVTGKTTISLQKRDEISREFYKKYNEILHGGKHISGEDCFIESIKNVDKIEERREIAQLTINRLLFIKFLYERGFIKILPSDSDFFDYLKKLETTELNRKLKVLFFNIMNTPKESRTNVDMMFDEIPYLNGSLFEKAEVEKNNSDYLIDSKIIQETINLLDAYNFADKEIGEGQIRIDPEILGYIFESAMTAQDRKGTGAFYTKKSITIYMAKKAIYPIIINKVNKYLEERGFKEAELISNINQIFTDLKGTTLSGVREIIKKINICDNACGSGAFIIMAANVLFEIYKRIDNALNTKNTDIWIKKQIVSSLYGIDTNARAIEITMLRIWLWVAESFTPDVYDDEGYLQHGTIEPLPNLEYHFMVGNSLIGYDKLENITFQSVLLDSDTEVTSIKDLLKECVELKKVYQNTSRSLLYPERDPRKMKERIEEIRAEIKKNLDVSMYADIKKINNDLSMKKFIKEYVPFHWILEFYEVYIDVDDKINRGFDIVIGNPPYIQLQNKEMISEEMQKAYGSQNFNVFEKTGDIYCLFYEKGMNLLKENGILCYITSKKWMRAKYGKKLRIFFNKYNPITLLDFEGIKNFKSATVDTNILIIAKEKNKNKLMATKFNSEYNEDEDMDKYVIKHQINLTNLTDKEWFIGTQMELDIKEKIEKIGTPIKDWSIDINRGVLTGFNEAFIINEKKKSELISKDPKSVEIIKPLIRGRDIKKWYVEWGEKWLINSHNGYEKTQDIKIDNYPAIKQHLDDIEQKRANGDFGETAKKAKGLLEREDQGKTPYNLRNCAYINKFEGEKIVWLSITDKAKFAIDIGSYVTAPAYFMTSNYNKYLISILNSKVSEWYLDKVTSSTGQGTNQWSKIYIKKIPIPSLKTKNKTVIKQIETLVDKILNKKEKNEDTKMEENEIDVLVYNLYDLSWDEVKIIDPEFTLSKKDYDAKMEKGR